MFIRVGFFPKKFFKIFMSVGSPSKILKFFEIYKCEIPCPKVPGLRQFWVPPPYQTAAFGGVELWFATTTLRKCKCFMSNSKNHNNGNS